jgi:hypothetical protein
VEYPEVMRWLAKKENVALIDLNEMTVFCFNALGVEESKKALVHFRPILFRDKPKRWR